MNEDPVVIFLYFFGATASFLIGVLTGYRIHEAEIECDCDYDGDYDEIDSEHAEVHNKSFE